MTGASLWITDSSSTADIGATPGPVPLVTGWASTLHAAVTWPGEVFVTAWLMLLVDTGIVLAIGLAGALRAHRLRRHHRPHRPALRGAPSAHTGA